MSSLAIRSSPLEVGSKFPDGDVVVMDGKMRKVVKMSSQLTDRDVVIFLPAAFTRVCSEEHLPSYDNAEWGESGYKIHCISTDTVNALEKWKDDFYDLQMNMISNCKRTFCPELLIDNPTLGVVFKRASAVVEKGVVQHLNIEDDSTECTISSGNSTLKQIKKKEVI